MKALTAVYSYYFPEIRRIVSETPPPHDILLRSVHPGLDDYHQPIIEKFLSWQRAPDLRAFPHRYPISGGQEGIREYLTMLAAQGIRRIYTLPGEYEGYRETAATRGIETIETEDPSVGPGVWMLSNPSARDGCWLPDDLVRAIGARHRVFHDLTYLGMTPFRPVTVDAECSIVSFSKPFGLFYYRIGFAFSRAPIPSLVPNKWFKNVPALHLVERIMDAMGPYDLSTRYALAQAEIVRRLNHEHGLALEASDVFLLARQREAHPLLARYRRGGGYRLCLTPYFLEREAGGRIAS